MRLLYCCTLLGIAWTLSGCTTPVYEGRYRWQDGWREGVVEKIGKDERLANWFSMSCDASPSAYAKNFARVRWSQVGKSRWWIVALREGSTLKAGDTVYVNVSSCSASVVPRAGDPR
jgi:hypothetical protein